MGGTGRIIIARGWSRIIGKMRYGQIVMGPAGSGKVSFSSVTNPTLTHVNDDLSWLCA